MRKDLEAINYLFTVNGKKSPDKFIEKFFSKDSPKSMSYLNYVRRLR